jgi:hypothetical protein
LFYANDLYLLNRTTFDMPVQDIQKYEKACREYRIIFTEELDQSEPPTKHHHIWNALQSPGDTKYTTYLKNAKPEERWKLELKKRVLTINEQARRCVNRNEWNWRFAAEPLMFSRISSEVCWYVASVSFFFHFIIRAKLIFIVKSKMSEATLAL